MQPNGGTQRCAAGTGLRRTWWPVSSTAHRPVQGRSVTVASPAFGVDEAAVVVAQGDGVEQGQAAFQILDLVGELPDSVGQQAQGVAGDSLFVALLVPAASSPGDSAPSWCPGPRFAAASALPESVSLRTRTGSATTSPGGERHVTAHPIANPANHVITAPAGREQSSIPVDQQGRESSYAWPPAPQGCAVRVAVWQPGCAVVAVITVAGTPSKRSSRARSQVVLPPFLPRGLPIAVPMPAPASRPEPRLWNPRVSPNPRLVGQLVQLGHGVFLPSQQTR